LAYRDGELNLNQTQRIANHLEICSECRLHGELDRWQVDRLLSPQHKARDEAGTRRAEFLGILRSMRSSNLFLTKPLLSLLVGRRAAAHEGLGPVAGRIVKPIINVILVATLVHVMLGLIVWSGWQFTGSLQSVRSFFNTAGDLFLAELSAAALYIAVVVCRSFSRGEPLGRAWFFICAACGCDLAGSIFSKLLATHANPLWPCLGGSAAYHFGLLLGGPIRFGLLAWGLYCALRAYHRSGILTFRLSKVEHLIVGCLVWYTLCENIQGVLARRADGLWTVKYFLETSTDPLLLAVFVAALLLRRSVHNLGARHVAHCWTAMAWGFGFIFLGNMTTWAMNSSYLPLRVTSFGWNLWFAAAAAFPLACAYQLQAMVKTAEYADGCDPYRVTAGRA
jgi:hypothetical protein